MKDLTTGSIPRHLLRLAAPMALGMIFQTLYYFVDLYFVGRLGDTANTFYTYPEPTPGGAERVAHVLGSTRVEGAD